MTEPTNLRALLGDRHDAVIDKAAATITGVTLPYFVARVPAGASLAAVLPGLLAEAWDEGVAAMTQAVVFAREGSAAQARAAIRSNPYRPTEESA